MVEYSNLKRDQNICYFVGDQFVLLRDFVSEYNAALGEKYIIM